MKIQTIKNTNSVLILCLLVLLGLYYGASLLIPFTIAAFLATLIFPVLLFLEKKTGIGNKTSSFIGVLLVFVGVSLLAFFFINQLVVFMADIVQRQEEILSFFRRIQGSLESWTGYSMKEQEELLRERIGGMLTGTQKFVAQVLSGTAGFLLDFLLVFVFMFLLLLNRDKFVTFLMMYTKEERKKETREIVQQTRKVAHKYLWGRIQVMGLLAIMYLIAFTAYGLRHTWLLLIFGTLITVIPYLGPLLSAVLPMLFMVIFGDSPTEIVSFILVVFVIQLIESYVLEPVIIGAEVQQSPLFVIIAILLGGAIWGLAGLILFVPVFAILKIIFDHNPDLQPVGFLIGYERPGSGKGLLDKIKKKIKG